MSKKRKFFIFVAALMLIELLVIATLTFVSKQSFEENLLSAESKKQKILSQEIARVLETDIQSIHEKLNLVAQFSEVQSSNPSACNKKLNEVFSVLNTKVNNMVRIDNKGIIYCAVNKAAIGLDTTTDPDFKKIIIDDPKHEPILHRIIFSPVSNKFVVGMHVPVFDNNQKFLGTVGGVIYLDDLEEKYLKNIGLNQTTSLTLYDDNRDILSHPAKDLVGKNVSSPEIKKLSDPYPTLDKLFMDAKMGKSNTVRYNYVNADRIGSYSPVNILPGRHWIVFLIDTEKGIISQATGEEKSGQLTTFLALGAIFALIIILAKGLTLIYQTKDLFNPLTEIKDMTQRIGEGDFDAGMDSKLLSSKDEFGILARSLRQTAIQLKDSYSGLEGKVKDQTAQLDNKIKELEDTQTAMLHVMKDLKETGAKNEAVLESIGDGMVAIDTDAKVIIINEATEKLLGWSKGELVGKNWFETALLKDQNGKVVSVKERPTYIALTYKKKITTAATLYFYERKDKTNLPVGITVTPIILDGKTIGSIEVFRDISLERNLQKVKDTQLKHETELETKERDFVSVASHQLLTPLSLISGYISMLISGKLGTIDKEAKDSLEESFKGTERMSTLVKDLLATSRIESGNIKIEKTSFDIYLLIKGVVENLKSKWEAKGLTIDLPKTERIMVLADEEQTRQVLTNILDNAIKYTDKGGITINSSVAEGKGQVEITDTGVGIDKKTLPHIFEKFLMSANWVSKQSESHGLGLYIARLLLGMMDGTIIVESKQGKGTTFTISLPLSSK